MADVKQVIVMRTDLNMRKGKMIAQGAHASIAWLTNRMDLDQTRVKEFYLGEAEHDWVTGRFTKIVVRVDSLYQLLYTYHKACKAGIVASLIRDAGLTEFHGELTYTCCAIGPDFASAIDEITGHLKLL